jgi:plastocyanin
LRRIFALLLVTPLLANCADSATPVAPAGAVLSEGDVSTEVEWIPEENSLMPGDVFSLTEEGMSLLSVGATSAEPAVMVLGNPEAGTSYPPGAHDQSYHGRDRMIPGALSVAVGQPVTFVVKPGHRVAIYRDGVKPDDISPNNPGPFVLDPVRRLFLQGAPVPQFTGTFNAPGKYLVICAIKTHFFNANMWAWVIVK